MTRSRSGARNSTPAPRRGSRTGHGAEGYGNTNVAKNLTFATVPLTFGGADTAKAMMAQDRNVEHDQADIKQDLAFIASRAGKPVAWRWYQEGYDHEPTDTSAECQPR